GEDQHVEPCRLFQQIAPAEEVERRVSQFPLFALIHGLGGAAVVLVLGRAHLDEHDPAPIPGDNVDFTTKRVDVPGEDAKPSAAEEASGGALGTTAEPTTPPWLARRRFRHCETPTTDESRKRKRRTLNRKRMRSAR